MGRLLIARLLIARTMSSLRAQLALRLRVCTLFVLGALVVASAIRSHAFPSRRGLQEGEETCEGNQYADPLDLQVPWQASFYMVGFLYICLGIAMICEEYFVTALNELIEVKGITPDVAGATFMAAGSSSPEVFAALIGLFFSSSEGGGAGVGTVVGSAVFNVLVIIGGAALYSDRGISMEWRTLSRDSGFYALSLVALYACFYDGTLTSVEASGMVALYVLYLVVCFRFPQITGCMCPEKTTTKYQDLEKATPGSHDFALGEDNASMEMVRKLMLRMEKDRYVLFKEARRSIVAPLFGASGMTTDMSQITQQERATLRKAFDTFDRSKTGVINPGDITKMLQQMGIDTKSDLVADLWLVLDRDKTNKITFEEFAPVYINWHRYGLRQEQKIMLKPEEVKRVRSIFEKLDVSRTGWLSQGEMDAAFEHLLGSEEDAGLVDRQMVVTMLKHSGAKAHEMTFDAFRAMYTQWFGYSGALYDADTSNLAAGVPNTSAKPSLDKMASSTKSLSEASAQHAGLEHGEHQLLQWPATLGAQLNYVAGFPFAFLFHFTVPNCAVEKWRSWYPTTMLMSIVWLGLLVFLMIEWAEKAGCLLGINETLMGLTVCAIGTSGPDAIASLIVAKEGNGVMAVSNAFGSNVFDILFGLGFPFMLKTMMTGPFEVSTHGLSESIYIMFGVLFLFLAICGASKLVVSRALGAGFLVLYAVYLVFTIATNM